MDDSDSEQEIDLDDGISDIQDVISSLSISNPLRVPCLQVLALARFRHYETSKQLDDLDKSIVYFTEAILLPFPCNGDIISIFQMFYFLALALFYRIEAFKHPEDFKSCIMYLRYLQDQPPGVFDIDFGPKDATEYLVRVLVIKVELDLGDVMRDIEEIVDLCHKHLNSDISTTSQNAFILALRRVLRARFGRWSRREEHKIIQCLQEANMRRQDLHHDSMVVANFLYKRFKGTNSIDDYEEGTAILDAIIAFCASGDMPSPHREMALKLATYFASHRYHTSARPGHLEDVVHRFRNLLDGLSPDDPNRPGYSAILSRFQNTRGLDLDQVGIGRSARNSHSSKLESPDHPPFQDLTASLTESNNVTFSRVEHLNALSSVTGSLTEMSEIELIIKYCRQLLASSLSSELGLTDFAKEALSIALQCAFWCTKKIEYLNEAISVLRDFCTNPGPGSRMLEFSSVFNLITFLSRRFRLLHHGEDLNELMRLFPIVVDDIRGPIPDRFLLSCKWADTARSSGHPSIITAYSRAISLMPASLTSSPTLLTQHLQLVTMHDRFQKLPLDYASYLISKGQLQGAVETLERGRALIWSEMRGFRTSTDKLRSADSKLAEKFTAVNRELEILSLTVSSGSNLDGEDAGMGLYGDLVVRQQRLLDDREKLILHIQAMRGFDTFLKQPSFDTLRSAALRGPIIIINHCRWRSDILILLHNSPPSLIYTTEDFYGRANKLRDRLLGERSKGLESNEYEGVLKSVLEELYELVGRPVIQRLDELHVPKQSRVWWCPTSAFCSLPLHAMGPIPSDAGRPKYFLDLYIPSYTPTISALIDSNRPGSQVLDKPSVLLVSQPDESIEKALDEVQVVQSACPRVTSLISEKATPTAVLGYLQDHRFIHIVCHGILETGKPFESSFQLYGDSRLSLLEIVRSQLPDGEFAFLAACHTAELTDGSLADEALHLTAAMQYCGYRSVVGTMWAMADTDGQALARNFYKSVFSGRRKGVPHYERTAEALRDSVTKLRRKTGMTLERWVNFVHYGA